MNCPTCNGANPNGAKFCNNCGTRLPAGCPNCGHANQPGSKFCNNCGFKLRGYVGRAAAAQRRTNPLDRYLPPEMRAKLEAARSTRAGAGERRIVTILFCDVKGSTAAASQLDPEEWAEIINGAFEHMIAPVYRYEGTVARLMGDGILAFFGARLHMKMTRSGLCWPAWRSSLGSKDTAWRFSVVGACRWTCGLASTPGWYWWARSARTAH